MQIQKQNIVLIIALITGIFLVAAMFMFFYIIIFNERKKRHRDEKETMRKTFDDEMIRTSMEVQEHTRKNLAGELHDNIGQLLSLTSVILGSVSMKDERKAAQKVSDAHELVLRSIKDLRHLSRLIHGDQLLTAGLMEGVRQEIIWLEKSGRFIIEPSFYNMETAPSDPEKDLLIFRLFQESVSNIIKHSEADRIAICLTYDDDSIQLTVRDNGKGFSWPAVSGSPHGLGLQNMQRRVDMLRGRMEIRSDPGQGATLHFFIPYT